MLAYLASIASGVSISVSAFMMVSAVIYYFQPRHWGYREVVAPYARGTCESLVFFTWAMLRAALKPFRGLPVVGEHVTKMHKAIGGWELKRRPLVFPVGVKFDLSISDEQLQEILEDEDEQSKIVDKKLEQSTVDKFLRWGRWLNELLFALLCFLASGWFVMVCILPVAVPFATALGFRHCLCAVSAEHPNNATVLHAGCAWAVYLNSMRI